MKLITNTFECDLNTCYYVTEAWCTFLHNELTIHLSCQEGDEQKVIDNLPKWIHNTMKITKSYTHVFLSAKK